MTEQIAPPKEARQNSSLEIKKFLFKLSEGFPYPVKTSTLESHFDALKAELKNENLHSLHTSLVKEFESFPSVKQIISVVRIRRRLEFAKQHSAELDVILNNRERVPLPENIRQSEAYKKIFGGMKG